MGLKFLRMAKSSGANVIKLFTAANYKFSQKAREFVRGNSFYSSLMFVGKSGAFLSEAPFRCSTLGEGSWPSGLTSWPHISAAPL